GGAVPAETLEMRRACGERAVEVEGGDRAARAFPELLGPGDQDDRAVVPLDEPRRDDPDHPLVPVLSGEDVAAPPPARLGPLLHLRDGRAENPVLDRLP